VPNRLINETSPYLLQHAHNPVDWYPWGDEAIKRAVQEDKPILLSIGYSACHWCHVMEHESFENTDIVRLMNQNFINIKVDREERPDLDAVYMDAVHAITGSGGWPLTVFLTPQLKPFYGGTYFPPEDRHGLPGFPQVLQMVAEAYKTRKGEVDSAAAQIIDYLNRSTESSKTVEPLTDKMPGIAYTAIRASFDAQNGGFGQAPKFPQPMLLEFLLRQCLRTGDPLCLLMVEHTLMKMARGGIHDRIGGGFHRYSVDACWLVPHFEKMLYDNALLSRVYLHAYQATGKQLYRRVVEETLDYVLREMTDKNGGFYSSQDADSEGVEGKFYVWTPDEIKSALGKDDTDLVIRYFGVTEQGNFEGKNILSQVIETQKLASELGLTPEELESSIARAKARLLEKRALRIAPHRDEKILTDWNGLMLASMAEAASVLERDDYLKAAISNATFIVETLYDGKVLKHTYKDGKAKINGYLSDYALLNEGLISLYQATFAERWLRLALKLADATLSQFWDENKGHFYDTARGQDTPLVRPRSTSDNAVPSGSSAAAFMLLRLARLTDNRECERIAAAAMRSVQELMVRYPPAFGHWLCALDAYLSKPLEIAVIGNPEDTATKSLMRVVSNRYSPNKILAVRKSEKATQTDIPLLRDRSTIDGRATVYVCEDRVCKMPVNEPDALAAILDKL
jgi:uncharacterized protein YyaL (SSP411 family)